MAKAEAPAGMVSMMRTAAENKAMQKAMQPTSAGPKADYPYGLVISLGEAELKKLGLEREAGADLPAVGDELHLAAVVKVTRVSESASESQPDSCNVELQITHLNLTGKARTTKKPEAPKRTVMGG